MNQTYTKRGLSLNDILESEKEPISIVIISHQYLTMLIELALSIKITGRYKVLDKDIELVSRSPLPTKAALLLASAGKKNPKLIERLQRMK